MPKTLSRSVDAAIENAYQAELRGEYREGLEHLRFFWDFRNPESVPDHECYEKPEYADLLLRVGALFGFFGVSKPEAQETSKNLLTHAYQLFDEDSITEKCASCSNYLALTYWRMGAADNAQLWLLNAFIYDIDDSHPFRLHSHIVQSMIDISSFEFEKCSQELSQFKVLFEKSSSSYLKACFYTNLAIAEKELGRAGSALLNFENASKWFSRINNRRYLAYVENNVALLYKNLSRFRDAYRHAGRCLHVSEELNDKRQIGCSLDTHAQIAFAEGDYERAAGFSSRAIETLSQTENYGYLVESYETKIKIYLKSGKTEQALLDYGEALAVARFHTSPEIVQGFVSRIAAFFDEKLTLKIYRESGHFSAGDFLEVVFPRNFEPVKSIAGVEMVTDRLVRFGIRKGFLAVIEEKAAVKNGDLVCLYIPEIKAYQLGVLSFVESMIVIETEESVPLTFLKSEVELLGKIIGYCDGLPDADGKVYVTILENENLRRVES